VIHEFSVSDVVTRIREACAACRTPAEGVITSVT
jgi:hypothetical protein